MNCALINGKGELREKSLLEINGLTKRFGRLTAVNGVSIQVERGRITGLIGPNGAGKTTLFNLITGVLKPDGGKICYKGRDITNFKPHEIARMGIGRTWQLLRIFSKMTVIENLMIAAIAKERTQYEKALEILDLFGLTREKDNYADELSIGQQKILSVARVLMFDSELMLLDELAAGLNLSERGTLLDIIHELCEGKKKTFFIVEHDMDVVMGHCDRVICMNFGEIIGDGSCQDIQKNEAVIEAYFGA